MRLAKECKECMRAGEEPVRRIFKVAAKDRTWLAADSP